MLRELAMSKQGRTNHMKPDGVGLTTDIVVKGFSIWYDI
jgi:hypothetical protein